MVIKIGTILAEKDAIVIVKSEDRLYQIKESKLVRKNKGTVEFDDKDIEVGDFRFVEPDNPDDEK